MVFNDTTTGVLIAEMGVVRNNVEKVAEGSDTSKIGWWSATL